MSVVLHNVSVAVSATTLVHEVNATMGTGEIIGIIGPNGAGKSSLIKAIAGLLPYSGTIEIAGQANANPDVRSKLIAYVEQRGSVAWPLSVDHVVTLGRLPYATNLSRLSKEDAKAVADALDVCSLSHMKNRLMGTLSGGEFARVMLARALASSAPVLLLDEPLAGLDLKYQRDALGCISLAAKSGKTIIISMHDLSTAARWCSRVLLLNHSLQLGFAPVSELLQNGSLENAFGLPLITATHGTHSYIHGFGV